MTKLWADSDTKFKYNHKNYRDFQFFFFLSYCSHAHGEMSRKCIVVKLKTKPFVFRLWKVDILELRGYFQL